MKNYNDSLILEAKKIRDMLQKHDSKNRTINSTFSGIINNDKTIDDQIIENNDETVASVLVPLIPNKNGNGFNVLLTLRSKNLNRHAGQVSFPGGKLENTDKSFFDCAIRETNEELGISPRYISILGSFFG